MTVTLQAHDTLWDKLSPNAASRHRLHTFTLFWCVSGGAVWSMSARCLFCVNWPRGLFISLSRVQLDQEARADLLNYSPRLIWKLNSLHLPCLLAGFFTTCQVWFNKFDVPRCDALRFVWFPQRNNETSFLLPFSTAVQSEQSAVITGSSKKKTH